MKWTLFSIAERRKRQRRPPGIIIAAVCLCSVPVLNYFGIAKVSGIYWKAYPLILQTLHPVGLGVVLLAPLAGFGLFTLRRWGWYCFTLWCVGLLGYNIFAMVKLPLASNIHSLAGAVLGTGLLAYILRRDISSPYFGLFPRGFRLQKRLGMAIAVRLPGQTFTTRDISTGGLYLNWKECDLSLGDQVSVQLQFPAENFDCYAGVVRVDPDEGVGLAFRGLGKAGRLKIRQLLGKAGTSTSQTGI